MKPGWKSSEFWLNAVASLLGVLLTSGVVEATATNVWGIAASVLTAIGYTVSRAVVKASPAGVAELQAQGRAAEAEAKALEVDRLKAQEAVISAAKSLASATK